MAGPICAQQHEDNHLRDFKRKLIWKGPLAKTLVSATFNEIRDSPHEWGRGWEGFGKRAGNSFGQRAIKATVELGVSEWTHEDLHYRRLGEGPIFRRIRHAAVTTFWVRRDNGEGSTLAAGRISGAFAAGTISRAWMPDRVATFGAGMETFGSSLGLDVGFNLFREFWPRKR
ncbi:MAG: hypothetical protein ABI759_15790 [Candidatus Solibacter sp.]